MRIKLTLERAITFLGYGLATAAAISTALIKGLSAGVNNQVLYLLPALRLIDGQLLKNDWYLNAGPDPHPLFRLIGAPLLALDESGWALGIANVATIVALFGSLYLILRTLLPRLQALAALPLVLAALIAFGEGSIAQSYLYSRFLQPSSFGALGLLLAALFFLRGQWLKAGLAAAIGGALHINYLVLLGPVFGIAHLVLREPRLLRRATATLLPMTIVLLCFVPTLLSATGEGTDAGRELLFRMRAPHHYHLQRFVERFVPFVAWSIIGLAALLSIGRNRRLVSFLLGLLAVIWIPSLAIAVTNDARLTALFVWRLAPFVEVLCMALLAAAVVAQLFRPDRVVGPSANALFAYLVGSCALILYYATRNKNDPLQYLLLLGGLIIVGVLGRLFFARVAPAFSIYRIDAARSRLWSLIALMVCCALWLAAASRVSLKDERVRSSLLRGAPDHLTALYLWVRQHTPKDAVFVIPPNLENFRFHARRAVVVDWKGAPMIPRLLPEWHRRMVDVIGAPVSNEATGNRGYARMTDQQLRMLAERYGATHAILPLGSSPLRQPSAAQRTLKRIDGFAVFKIADGAASKAAPRARTQAPSLSSPPSSQPSATK
ncbi:MAG: hypothetical protein H6707_19320 [Deltaproteobacteria bacterium]|nr:hypothetical protein [Deltaproteobacteria bacterium]